MGRKRTQLSLTPAQRTKLAQRLQMVTEARAKDRLRFALLAAEGQHTLEDLAVRLGRSRSTLQLWLDKFTAGGLAGLLERESPPGWLSPVGREAVQAELQAGINSGRWRSAAAIAEWLQAAHGITRARKSIYYWLGRNGWTAPGARLRYLHKFWVVTADPKHGLAASGPLPGSCVAKNHWGRAPAPGSVWNGTPASRKRCSFVV